jgi:hypothetical protein
MTEASARSGRGARTTARAAGGLLLALSGCTAAAWRDRAHDLAEILDVSASLGPGWAASVRATELAQVGFGSLRGESAGVVSGRLATASEERSEFGVSLLHTYEYRRRSRELLDVRQPYFSDPGYDPYPFSWQMETDRHAADFGFDLHVAYVGVHAALHLDQVWDFVAGCFCFDPLKDDAFGRSLEELRRQAASLDPSLRDRAFDALKRRGESTHGYAIYTARDVRPSFQRRAIEEVTGDNGAR